MKWLLTQDVALLILRISAGSMMLFMHGLGKLQNFSTLSDSFPDPIGLGSTFSLCLAIFAELFCSAAVILGLKTRFAAVPLLITMLVAGFIIHADDPWSKKELALLYATSFAVLAIIGGGKFSLDSKLPGQ